MERVKTERNGKPLLSIVLCLLHIVLFRFMQGGYKQFPCLLNNGISRRIMLQNGDGPVNLTNKARILFLIIHNKQLLQFGCIVPVDDGR